MSYIKLKVISGGIYIKTEKLSPKSNFLNVNMDFNPHPENQNQKVLSLVRDSSIKGLFSYFMGETKKLKDIQKSSDTSVQKLNSTLDSVLQSVSYKKISEPHITIFFERKDSCNKRSQFKTNPKINLYQHNFETADPTIKLLRAPLENIMKNPPQSLEDIHYFFETHVINNKKNEIEYNKIKSNKKNLNLSNIPESKLKQGIKTAIQRIEDNKPISSKIIQLINEICILCEKNKDFYNKIKNSEYGKFSVFTDLSNTKQWVDKEYHSIVRGAPAFIAQVDFDIYLSQGAFEEKSKNSNSLDWDELVDKIKAGPNIARWGEGGVVLLEYHLDAMGQGYDTKDQMFVEIKALRHAGMNIKKYDWEEKIKKKSLKESENRYKLRENNSFKARVKK